MIWPRRSTIGTIVVAFVAVIVSTIWRLEIETFWQQTMRPYVMANAWSWVVAMLDYLTGFWGGVFVTIIILVAFDLLFGLRRRNQRDMLQTTTPAPMPFPIDRPVPDEFTKSGSVIKEEESSPQYKDLLAFFLDHLEPVASAQLALRRGILSIGVSNDRVHALAGQGLTDAPFYKSVSLVSDRLSSSPPENVSFHELTVSIHNAEFSHRQLIDQTDAFARSFGLNIESNERLWKTGVLSTMNSSQPTSA